MKNIFNFKKRKEEKIKREKEIERKQKAAINKLNKYINNLLLSCVNNISDNEFTVNLIHTNTELLDLTDKCKLLKCNFYDIQNAYTKYIRNDKNIYYKVNYDNFLYINDKYEYPPILPLVPHIINFTKIKYAIEV
jgi:hypothetical protein